VAIQREQLDPWCSKAAARLTVIFYHRGDHGGDILGWSHSLSIIIFIEILRTIYALVVAAVLQYFVVLVACQILLIGRNKRRRKYWVKPWLTTRTVHGAYHSLFTSSIKRKSKL